MGQGETYLALSLNCLFDIFLHDILLDLSVDNGLHL